MHLSPLFSSKKIVLSPLSPAGFFFAITNETWLFLPCRPIFPVNMPALQKMLRRVIGPSFSPPILASSAVQATDMPDYRQVCRDGTPLLFHDCGGHRQGARHGEQLSTLGPLIWVFGPRPRGPFFA